jgi:serine protease Do
MRLVAAFACAVMLICLGIVPGHADKRVALVIGNGAYPRAGLANPVNDAGDVTAALRGIGFEVVPGTDLSLTGFAQIIDTFREKAKGADVALVYYAGHAMQFEDQNWLMPIDTRVTSAFDVRHYNVALQDLIAEIESDAKTTLVFLDACRDNPLDDELKGRLKSQGRSYGDARGLARLEIKARDTLVVFATRPNTTAADGRGRRNSPFTEAFLENLPAPGVEIEVLMKRVTASVAAKTQGRQEPERLSRLKSEFYFVPSLGPGRIDQQAAIADVAASVIDAVVKVAGRKSNQAKPTFLGPGFIIDSSGLVVTPASTIADLDEITVTLKDRTDLKAEIVGQDPKSDIALLRIRTDKPLKTVKFGDSDKLRIGGPLILIGHPHGLDSTVTAAMVTGLNRDISSGPFDDYIQTDVAYKGMGPLFNFDGEVVGIGAAFIPPPPGTTVTAGFAIPSKIAAAVIDQLRLFGKVRRGWIGWRGQAVTDEIADSLAIKPARGVLVSGVEKKSPGELAGIEPGDLIVKFDDRDINDVRGLSGLARLTADTPPGTEVEIIIVRKGKEEKRMVTVGLLADSEKPAPGGADAKAGLPQLPPGSPFEEFFNEFYKNRNDGTPALQRGADTSKTAALGVPSVNISNAFGIELATMTEDLRKRYKIKDTVKGVIIAAVNPAGEAAAKKVKAGEVIVEVAQQAVASPAELQARVDGLKKDGRKTALLLISDGEGTSRFAMLPLP